MLLFHLDENMHFALASALRKRGLDVTTTPPDVPKGASDEQQLAYALMQNRVIVSYDVDLVVLHSSGVQHAGIAYCPKRSRTIGEMATHLALLSREYEPQDMHGRVEYV